MKFDCILGNPPYGKIGVDITKTLINEVPHEDISILGTTAMLSKHNEHLALEYVYIDSYVLNPASKVPWVRQLILLGYRGSCKAIPTECYSGSSKEEKPNEIRVPYAYRGGGQINSSLNCILTRNHETSFIISVSDDDYEYIKNHWDDMNVVERFWWFVDRGFYKRFETE